VVLRTRLLVMKKQVFNPAARQLRHSSENVIQGKTWISATHRMQGESLDDHHRYQVLTIINTRYLQNARGVTG